eukprot:CAMPEP_0197600516 /NCGR_PEP_ID=MMETSP1326-20131121/33406_1 /TAXON_ID=1155430 /ORGANISM="Genus nov. species nov., Strain RCC2288" /LENGTH=85 /DNA_ID=CAMNT_0043167623 /DNA_START=30 /DNA_END=284 /DNA_ORIENTATION=+
MRTAAALLCGAALAATAAGSPLWDYVNTPDAVYNWVDTGFRYNETGWSGYMLNLTSQTWLTPAESDRSVWTHQLLVVIPDNLVDT